MSNFTTVFLSFIYSCICIFIYMLIFEEVGDFMILMVLLLMVIAFIAYLGIEFLMIFMSWLNFSEITEYVIKIIYTILFYTPFSSYLLSDDQKSGGHFILFAISSFICTISIITYQYKHLFQK